MAERTDDDKFEGMQFPPDRPIGAEDRGVTDVEDSVDERARRENPDRWASKWPGDVDPIVDDADESGMDDEPDAVATEARHEPDPLGLDRSVQDLEEIEPAEEAAMHITDDPPYDADDGYVE